MKCILTILVLIIIINHSNCQNLVPNPSFEYVNCDSLLSGINLLHAPPWNSPDAGTADLFNLCATSANPFSLSVPGNVFGYQYPHSGNGYAGAVCYSSPTLYREYLQVKLDSFLVPNQVYDVSFYVTLSKPIFAACNNIGLYFSKTEISTNDIF